MDGACRFGEPGTMMRLPLLTSEEKHTKRWSKLLTMSHTAADATSRLTPSALTSTAIWGPR
jgi:hypothetical protein